MLNISTLSDMVVRLGCSLSY